ncbi:MAG: hypothetical protein KDJ26_05490 [Alphaproteobacteria bacterium]|jgi:Mg2+ and Co2+ transporter CorA|nr:hypothetical protein [Alphaproteobacteria bacterium]MCB1551438.1 hypothetical protein [Alphaproteobacteria bacterium]MCB9984437.1 hypothetical protein [Micavibrio sp.]HPQ50114.1 hypothetical protein [Alphaproteobacteria bacterium]HRK97798.1 hypothetical protein [Alphaproteobacteria bacterium]
MSKKIARWDLRETAKWVRQNKYLAGLATIFLIAAGVVSALGMLKWNAPILNWSFAAFLWAGSVFLLIQILKRNDKE